ncbi:(NiFe) hydrogenase maturation protein [Elusimicrobium minutum Pei191]|uniref:(NiFe) hydrogenase maturation protein n=1 Tax=Elusimicrobium minutum (strain Pei191) TaxID=445932 RepID=B2KBC3_ELUMP|nr:HypC/HybG/HupF family hydrogenase formation chaperone [Elusimicrobium minutum]ACC97945.1 (NiFe) hydrogenase maturation protein [Elusimicrobium minutum Pei191]
MCIAAPGKIIKINGENAEVDFGGVSRLVNASLKPEVKKGQYVLVHAGFIMEILDKSDAKERLGLLKETGLI